jgi:hypothetical protein
MRKKSIGETNNQGRSLAYAILILFFASGLLVLIPTDSNAVTVVVGGYGHATIITVITNTTITISIIITDIAAGIRISDW